jgi:hypothetical protein
MTAHRERALAHELFVFAASDEERDPEPSQDSRDDQQKSGGLGKHREAALQGPAIARRYQREHQQV